ncbi:MAG: hypothetical protein PVJ27_00210 [Candidatus Brocadiaceae bacterium]|jgi:ribonuclease HII
MPLWAGIDEAGYGPPLGPLVVAGTAFVVGQAPREGMMWKLLRDAVCRGARHSDGRLVINDSKQVYSPSQGLKRLEEGVLSFLRAATGRSSRRGGDLLNLVSGARPSSSPSPWFAGTVETRLPVATNASALASKTDVLRMVLRRCKTRALAPRAVVVLPDEFNRVVARTRNKSLLLFQKSGLILQELWSYAGPGESHVVVDRHGARVHYRRLLGDVFPHSRCDVVQEESNRSTYRISDGDRTLILSFLEEADCRVMPASLASMLAKYLRELYMLAFNRYWQDRIDSLKPTAGYGRDARRFLRDIEGALDREGLDPSQLLRAR